MIASPSEFELDERPDTQLESVVRDRIGNRIRDLRIVRQPDGVVLRGITATYHAKQLAQHAAMEAFRLPILANDIEVC